MRRRERQRKQMGASTSKSKVHLGEELTKIFIKFHFLQKCGQIEDAERIRIDSSPLHCPVCMLVYRRAPEVLPCGHSHCQDCLRRMDGLARRDTYGGGNRNNVCVVLLYDLYEQILKWMIFISNIFFMFENQLIQLFPSLYSSFKNWT